MASSRERLYGSADNAATGGARPSSLLEVVDVSKLPGLSSHLDRKVEDGPCRAWPNARERAWVYREQLAELKSHALRERFLKVIRLTDPAAHELLEDVEKHGA